MYFNFFVKAHVIHQVKHAIGHIVHNRQHDQSTFNENWYNAVSADGDRFQVQSRSAYNLEENFANFMREYLDTRAGLDDPRAVRMYAHRFAILDEAVGLDPSERDRITRRNTLLEEKMPEIKRFT